VGLDLADLLAGVLVLLDDEILQLRIRELRLAGPLKSLSPCLVAEPVANEVGVTGVDEDGNLLKDARDQTEVRLHPVTVEQEVTVNVEVARVVTTDLGAESLPHIFFVEILADIVHALVAQVGTRIALHADIVNILACALIRAHHGVVTVDGGRHAEPRALAVIARLNHGLATAQGVVHRLAALLIQNSGVTTLTASHGAVVLILSQAVSQTVSNEHGLEVDVALLV